MHSVRGEKQHAVKVLQLPEEDRDKSVDLRIVRALGQENVRLIDQQDRFPTAGDLESRGKKVFNTYRVHANLACRDRVKREFAALCDCFGRQSLANTRGAANLKNKPRVSCAVKVYILEQKVDAPPFPLDKILEARILIRTTIRLGECPDSLLLGLRQLDIVIG